MSSSGGGGGNYDACPPGYSLTDSGACGSGSGSGSGSASATGSGSASGAGGSGPGTGQSLDGGAGSGSGQIQDAGAGNNSGQSLDGGSLPGGTRSSSGLGSAAGTSSTSQAGSAGGSASGASAGGSAGGSAVVAAGRGSGTGSASGSGTNAVAAPPSCDDIRTAIINLANSLVGSHYLWGAGGDAPMTNENGVPYSYGTINRGIQTNMATPTSDPNSTNFAICAAQCSVAGFYLCAGRYGSVGGSEIAENDPALQSYLKTLGPDSSTWAPNAQGLSPRRVKGAAYLYSATKPVHDIRNKIVWGEDCRTKRHFDCVYFVMYCYNAIVPKTNWWMEISRWATSSISTDISSSKDTPASMKPADILIKTGTDDDGNTTYPHIGMYDGNGGVVQAQMAATGVLTETYNSGDWQVFRRVQCSYLLAT